MWVALAAVVVSTSAGAGAILVGGALEPAPEPVAKAQTAWTESHEHRSNEGFFWPLEDGAIPTEDQSKGLTEISHIDIRGDKDFLDEHVAKVVKGEGTRDSPYVFEGLNVLHDLYIQDTTVPILIRDNYIGGQLSLNYNGNDVYVHHNYVRDLRVNENIERSGDATGGVIEYNKIALIGQIRHFTGEIRYNEIGPRPAGFFEDYLGDVGPMRLKDDLVWNFDGWHNAKAHHNTALGYVELQLHGHSHGSCYVCPIHHHSDPARAMKADHTIRHHYFEFTDNEITVPEGVGLRYTDQAHAGDDRTANSEESEMLEKDHRHFTKIVIARNVVEGGSLVVDIFNSEDHNHKEVNPGEFILVDNVVNAKEGQRLLWWGWDVTAAIDVWATRDGEMSITGNTANFEERDAAPTDAARDVPWFGEWLAGMPPAALRLRGFTNSQILVEDNTGSASEYGIDAGQFESTTWSVAGNSFQAAKEINTDDTVPPPE